MIGWVVEVGGKSEWWRVMIGWEENVGREVVIFWDKSWGLKVVIFWDGGSIILHYEKKNHNEVLGSGRAYPRFYR